MQWFPGDEPKPAPPPLRLVQGFVNTRDHELHTDQLQTSDAAASWMRAAGLLAPNAALAADELRRTVGLREHLRAQLLHNNGGPPPHADAAIRSLVRRDVRLRTGSTGRLEVDLDPSPSGEQVLAQLLGIVFAAQVGGVWPRLKACRNGACAWAFYDASRNRGGSWCSMQECGNRLKNRDYRERQRAGDRETVARQDPSHTG